MAFQENLNASIYLFSFFRSHGSDVSHGSGCRVGFFQGYACDQDGELGDIPHNHHHHLGFFFFGVNLDYLDSSGGIFDL